MRYGYFDEERREYVIDRVDVPVSWTNYIGTKKMCGVFNHTAGGYLFYGSPEYHRITRFRPNGVPMDFPGHYVYLRDDETGEFWSISWQPAGKPLSDARYTCAHGFSYSTYKCDYNDILAQQTLFIAEDDPVEIWDVRLKNTSTKQRQLSVYTYAEFSFHHIDMDNRNFQMSLYAAGSRYEDGVIEHALHYEQDSFQFFTSNFTPDGFDCVRDAFIGPYRTEANPLAVSLGKCKGSYEKGGNHCACLQKRLSLSPGEEVRLIYLLGEGGISEGKGLAKKYANASAVDEEFAKLRAFWDEKCEKLNIKTPNEGLNALTNQWTLYQSEINVMFSRFSSFIEVGGRTGLGFRDTAQDAMSIPHSNPEKCRERIEQLLTALTSKGYGLHLFEPEWFEEKKQQSFKSPTIIPAPKAKEFVHGIEDACSDDALWLVGAVVNYIKETGDFAFLDKNLPYADKDKGSVFEHLKRILDFTAREVGQNGIAKGLRADWNDCLNLGGGESALVSFLHYWALKEFCSLACYTGREADAEHYDAIASHIKQVCEDVLWDGEWYIRGITANGKRIGTKADTEGRIHLESNAWAVLSGVAGKERGKKAMASVEKHLLTKYGLMLNSPPYTKADDDIGFVTRVYPGVKENGSIFSHPNPWAWAAACVLKDGDMAERFYNALCPYYQNDIIETRQAEPYSYCQFVMGAGHTAFGRARHPFMTGTAGWAYFASTQYMLGIRPEFDRLIVDPCFPKRWKEFEVIRFWRGSTYKIRVFNPYGVMHGVKRILLNGKQVQYLPELKKGTSAEVLVEMGVE